MKAGKGCRMKLALFKRICCCIIILTDNSCLVGDHVLVVVDSCEWNVLVLNRRHGEKFLEEKTIKV